MPYGVQALTTGLLRSRCYIFLACKPGNLAMPGLFVLLAATARLLDALDLLTLSFQMPGTWYRVARFLLTLEYALCTVVLHLFAGRRF
jgi:hypothetical protein